MRSFIDLVVIALATNQIVEIWRHSSLFQPVRYRLQIWQQESPSKLISWPTDLALCNWCLSVWVALLLVIVIPYSSGYMFILAFATSRVANLLNDVAYAYLRTPRYDAEPPPLVHPGRAEDLFDLKAERAALQEELATNPPNRETPAPDPARNYPVSETITGLFATPDSVSAKRNEEYKPPSSSAPPSGPIE